MFAVVTALTAGPIHRLQHTVRSLPPESRSLLLRLKSYVPNNFIKYRQELAELVGGRGEGGERSVNVLMYSACTFRDLTYIEELKDWREKEKEFINWKKMEMMFEVGRGRED